MISVAIANFNGTAFLRHAVASALAQRGVECEVLIVDDRSTDESWALAQQKMVFHRRTEFRVHSLDRKFPYLMSDVLAIFVQELFSNFRIF